MNLRDTFRKMPSHKLRELAGLCGGMAFLVFVTLVFSGLAPFEPQSLKLALNNVHQTTATANAAAVVYSSSGSYTTGPGVTELYVTVVGAGGGGAGSTWSGGGCSGDAGAGGAGGSGGYVENQLVSVSPNTTYPITVGQGGIGGVYACGGVYNNGNPGGGSSFGSLVTVTGGGGGTWYTGGVGGTPSGVRGTNGLGWYYCGPYAGGKNGTGYGSGGGSGCDASGATGGNGEVLIGQLQPISASFGNRSQIFLTSGTSWTVPSDWNSSNNTVEVIGGGGGGGNGGSGTPGSGGGGGAYAKCTNLSLTPGAPLTIGVGAGGSSRAAGGDTWFNATSLANAVSNGPSISCGAQHGSAGGSGKSVSGGAGGASASSVGAVVYSGGGGGATASNQSKTGAGGGAGGPFGAGGSGAAAALNAGGGGGGAGGGGGVGVVSPASPAGDGGTGGNNVIGTGGGAGGTTSASAQSGTSGGGGGGGAAVSGQPAQNGAWGGAGAEWGLYGSGGGGGSGGFSALTSGGSSNGGAGGLYGGGGGGASNSLGGDTGGAGGAGILTVTYTTSYPSTMKVGDSLPIEANFLIDFGDTGTLATIYGDSANPGAVTGDLAGTAYAATKTYTFTPTVAGTYIFYAEAESTYFPTETTYATYTVTVTSSAPALSITATDYNNAPTSGSVIVPVGGSTNVVWTASNVDASSCTFQKYWSETNSTTSPSGYQGVANDNWGDGPFNTGGIYRRYTLSCKDSNDDPTIYSQAVTVNITGCSSGVGNAGSSCSNSCAFDESSSNAPATISWCCPSGGTTGSGFSTGGATWGSVTNLGAGTYGLQCEAGGGTLNVINNTTLTSFSPAATRVQKGSNASLTWVGSNLPASCTLSSVPSVPQDGNISSGTSGSTAPLPVGPINQTTEFTITCGSANKSTEVTIVPTYQEL